MQQLSMMPRPRAPPQTWTLPRDLSGKTRVPRERWPWRAVQAAYVAVPAARRPIALYACGLAPQRVYHRRKERTQ